VLVVTTGQQPGLFTGPLYGVHKALSAAALASHLERRWERPVVPVFWIAGDDHDFAEANHSSWLAADGTLTSWSLPPRAAEAALTPMYRERLGEAILEGLEALESSLPHSEFRDATLGWLRRHYQPGQTVSGAYNGALAELLAPWGVVCFDSTHPAVKRRAAPWLMKAAGLTQDLDRDLALRDADLKAVDADPRVHVGDGASLVMIEAAQGRDRLVVEGAHLVTRRSGETFTLEELNALAAAEPERLSPNVLLRPVVESALLPTVAYVAGPGELRYLPLTDPVYRRLRVHVQVPVPRWSGLVVERRVDRVLEKFEATLDALGAPDQALERRVVLSHMPSEITEAVVAVTDAINRAYDVLAASGSRIDPTMAKPVEGSRRQALGAVEHIDKRLRGHLKKREATELRQIAHARTAVYPHDAPQERILGAPSLLARYGQDYLTTLHATIHDWYQAALEGEPVQS
jgi:bacillithiol biosynthesis cysteine-adding enzyme BshC